MSRNNNYTTGNLLDYAYLKENYKLIAIDISKQTELENPDLKQQINYIGKLEGQNNGETMFFVIGKLDEIKFCIYHIKMETQKIVNLLNSSENEFPKLRRKKWYVIDSETVKEFFPWKSNLIFNKFSKIKPLWLFRCIYFGYRRYSC